MKNVDKYKQDDRSDTEQDALFGPLIKAKFQQAQRDRWSQKLAEEYGVHRQSSPPLVRRSRRLKAVAAVAAAAAAALLIFFLQPFDTGPPESLQSMVDQMLYEDFFPNNLIRKGNTEALELIRQRAAEAYSKGDYHSAIQMGEQLQANDEADVWDEFYLSMSYLYNRQYERAIANLEKTRQLSQQGQGDFLEEIRWFTALAYLKSDRIPAAEERLRSIPPGEWKYDEAQNLLGLLEGE